MRQIAQYNDIQTLPTFQDPSTGKKKKVYSWGGNVRRKEVRNASNLSACSES
jgi:hypothetical protein